MAAIPIAVTGGEWRTAPRVEFLIRRPWRPRFGLESSQPNMKRAQLLNQSEQRTLDLLERSFLGRGYRVYAQVPLRRVIEKESGDELDLAQERMLRTGEFDFIIVNRERGYSVAFLYHTEAPIRWSPQDIWSQAHAANRTGNWLWAVDLAYAEHVALTDIERWAERHLSPITT